MISLLALLVVGSQFSKPSVKQQIRLGEDVAQEIRQHETVLPETDPRVVELRKVAARVLSSVHDKEEWEFSFDVVDDPELNAFALPGGPTFFFTGLMDKLKTEDELAGVLCHELTHVRQQHWAIQFAATQRRDLLINLGLVLLHANQTANAIAGVSDQLIFNLPFSRSQEAQADRGGFELMTAAGYNPAGLEHVFQMMGKTIRGDKPPVFLSDHPADKNRIDSIQAMIDGSGKTYPPEIPLGY
ncbi:MAG TPA: M48 family metalloprotease [Fimbriimonas sp.]|nr:M48 family metalloprotease [Fimbriimonas sp.]